MADIFTGGNWPGGLRNKLIEQAAERLQADPKKLYKFLLNIRGRDTKKTKLDLIRQTREEFPLFKTFIPKNQSEIGLIETIFQNPGSTMRVSAAAGYPAGMEVYSALGAQRGKVREVARQSGLKPSRMFKTPGRYEGARAGVPSSDNPVQMAMDKFFGKMSPKTPTKTYLSRLGQFRQEVGLPAINLKGETSRLIQETDPFSILRRYNEFTRYSGGNLQNAADLLPGGTQLRESLNILSRAAPSLEILGRGKEFYIGSPTVGYSPLPTQAGPMGNLVQVGPAARGAFGAIFVSPQGAQREVSSYTELYYKGFHENVKKLEGDLIKNSEISRIRNVKNPIVIFDIETVGKLDQFGRAALGAENEIVQFSATRIEGGPGGVAKKLNIYINPQGEIIYQGHGLTKEVLRKKGAIDLRAAAPEISKFLEGATLAGHNVKGFDIPVLQANLAKAGININLNANGVIDTLELERALHPGQPANLGAAFERATGRTLRGAHNAAMDVAATRVLLQKQLASLDPSYAKSLMQLGEEGISKGVNTLLQTLGGTVSAQTTMDSLRKLNNATIGYGTTGKSLRLRQLLGKTQKITGLSSTSLAAANEGHRAVVLMRELQKDNRFLVARQRYHEARKTISYLLKTRGLAVPQDSPFIQGLPSGISRSEILKRAFEEINQYAESIPQQFAALGARGMHSLIKPDFFVDVNKNLQIPLESARRIFGTPVSQRELKKGASGRTSVTEVTRSVAAQMERFGRRPIPYYMSSGNIEGSIAGAAGVKSGASFGMARPFRLAVVDFSSKKFSELFTQEGGALLTTSGLGKTIERQGLYSFNLKASERLLKGLHQLTGKAADLPENVGHLKISKKQYQRASAFRKGTSGFIPFKELSRKEKALRMVLTSTGAKRFSGVFESLASGTSGIDPKEGVLLHTSRKGGKINISMQSVQPMAAPHVALALGTGGPTVRFTGTAVRQGHALAPALEFLRKQYGVDALISGEEFRKLGRLEAFVETASRIVNPFLDPNNPLLAADPKLQQAAAFMQKQLGDSQFISPGARGAAIRSVTGYTDDLRQTALKLSGAIKYLRQNGVDTTAVGGLPGELKGAFTNVPLGSVPGMSGMANKIFVADVAGSIRPNQRLDQNVLNRTKLTVGKLKTIAMGGSLLGYASPYDDPLVKSLATQEHIFKWDVSKQDFVFSDKNPIKQFIKDIQTPLRDAPPPDKVVTFRDGKVFLGNKQIKNLPDIQAFGKKSGGVAAQDLMGTLLDPSVDDYFYIDIGSNRKLGLFGKDAEGKVLFEGAEHRYIPISKQMLRTEEYTTEAGRRNLTGPKKLKAEDGRVVFTRNSTAYNFIKAMNEMQAGNASARTLGSAVVGMARSLGGKKGILNKLGTIHVPTGYRTRLVPQTADIFNQASYTSADDIFKAAISRKQLIRAVQARKGMLSADVFADLMKTAETGKTFYAALLADPLQRAEHFSAFEVSILDQELIKPLRTKVGEITLDIQMHPLAYKIFERDTDLDAITAHLLDSTNYKSQAIKDRIRRQTEGMRPVMEFFRELGEKDLDLAKNITYSYFSSVEEAAVSRELSAALIGQKAFASLGYSGVRPTVERLIPTLVNAPMEDLVAKGIIGERALTATQVTNIRKLFGTGAEALKEFGGTAAIAQYIFQGGVQKGAGKSSLLNLFAGLTELGEETQQLGLDVDRSLVKAHKLFFDFIQGTAEGGKERIFQTGKLLEEVSSLPEVLKGLEQGYVRGTSEFLYHRAASLLARTMGLSYALADKVPQAYTLASFLEDETNLTSEQSVVKRLLGPITGLYRKVKQKIRPTGTFTGAQPGQAAGAQAAPPPPGSSTFTSRMSSLKQEILQDMTNISKSKMFKPAIAIAAIAAGVGVVNRLTAPDLGGMDISSRSLPPPTDTSTPTDSGPQLPSSFRPVARINGSSFTPSAGRYRSNRDFSPVSSNFFGNRVDSRLIIDDNVSSRQNSWLVRRQIGRDMDSDFSY